MSKYQIKSKNLSAKQKLEQRQKIFAAEKFSALFNVADLPVEKISAKNCENLIGSVEIPVGIAGDVDLQFSAKKKTYRVLLATTEGALIASAARGLKIINQAGGAQVFVKKIGMSRAPVFELEDGKAARKFEQWLKENFAEIQKITEKTSNHLELLELKTWIRGKYVFARFVFDTQQAMGMNMVTIALRQLWQEKLKDYPNLSLISLSGNMCVDKKPSGINRLLGRGYQAQAEVVLPADLVQKILKIEPKNLAKIHQIKNLIGSNVAESPAQNMHQANVLAAMFLATGQDMAHVVEAAQGSTMIELQADEKIYAAVNLPNLNLGTVGGGTYLPAFKQARELMNENLTPEELAGIMAATCLAAELSGLAALATHSLASAHQKLGREQKPEEKC